MPPQKQYDRTEVLAAATHAFWQHGYAATSINELVQRTGLNRGSLYAAFDDKRGLFLECLAHYDRRHRHDFLVEVSRGRAPRDAILAAFEAGARPSRETGLPPGCLFVNSALEVSPHDPEVREIVNASLSLVETFFRDNIRAAQAEGSVPPHVEPLSAAKVLLGLFLGMRVLVRSGVDGSAVAAVIDQAKKTLT